jgi:hypothetical protein
MVMMRDGKVMVRRNGETMPMEEELTIADGTKVMPNGQVLMNDGTARRMAEGEMIMITPRPTADPENLPDRAFKEAMEDEELRDEIPDEE